MLPASASAPLTREGDAPHSLWREAFAGPRGLSHVCDLSVISPPKTGGGPVAKSEF